MTAPVSGSVVSTRPVDGNDARRFVVESRHVEAKGRPRPIGDERADAGAVVSDGWPREVTLFSCQCRLSRHGGEDARRSARFAEPVNAAVVERIDGDGARV